MKPIKFVASIALATISAVAHSQEAEPKRAALLTELGACRGIAAAADRLACFDRTAARIDESERRGDLLVAERAEIQRSKRSLFGLNLPSFDLFRRSKTAPADEVREIESTLAGASYGNLKWTFVLADGARWRQTEPQSLVGPRKGDKVLIRRAAMGSFLLKLNGQQPAVRVERLN